MDVPTLPLFSAYLGDECLLNVYLTGNLEAADEPSLFKGRISPSLTIGVFKLIVKAKSPGTLDFLIELSITSYLLWIVLFGIDPVQLS